MSAVDFDRVARLPAPGDNVAIATTRLEADTEVQAAGTVFRLSHTAMEGHRFAVQTIEGGAALTSWGLPFGAALRDIRPGEYVCNAGMLDALGGRRLDFELPVEANFEDRITSYELDEATFRPTEPLPLSPDPPAFRGFDRGDRGAGTRNYVVVLGTSSRTAAYARLLAQRFAEMDGNDGFDGVVAVAHTEGGGDHTPNNRELLLRTLAGFAMHPNVGALLAVDYGTEAVPNRQLQDFLHSGGYPIERVPHRFLSIEGAFDRFLDEGEQQVRAWAPQLLQAQRTSMPVSRLKLALQCGGSDAFSGVSGNPQAAWAARELILNGGAANLAETDELIGAEPYVLDKVRDPETARRFLEMVERFKERASWHGASAEGNPSGGNKYRGLYNIVLKSIGAAMKRHPEVPLDGCLEYSQPIPGRGYWFMDSPGNDLESIAGQVASGCNVIYFVTGNGSITNFPFVPTVKIVTTSARFDLLQEDMDVNAGAYQDGAPMDELGRQLFDLTLEVASGRRSRGEEAGHSQVSVWRDWPQRDRARLETLMSAPQPTGAPLPVRAEPSPPSATFEALATDGKAVVDRVGLILPTSLCSGQVARMAAERLNAIGDGRAGGITRYAALVHTEGCGVSGGPNEAIYAQMLLGYLTHPSVALALLLEHGCEKTHNDYMRDQLLDAGVDAEPFGFASVQLDGGIGRVLERVETWFAERQGTMPAPAALSAGLESLRLGLLAGGELPDGAARALGQLTRWVVGGGGTVVIPDGAGLAQSATFAADLGIEPAATLGHGQPFAQSGLHVMEAQTGHWTEAVTGLGATGVEILLAHVGEHPLQGHPLIPMLQVSCVGGVMARYGDDLDAELTGNEDDWGRQLLDLILEVASRRSKPRLWERGNTDFQITRGLLGVSL